MKNILKYICIPLAALALMSACSSDDTYDIEGVKDNLSYIEGGTEALFQATECTIYHIPEGEEGEIAMTLTAGITQARQTATVVRFQIDNELVGETYSTIPEGILTIPDLTIPAGETKASQTISIAQSDFPKLTLPTYMVPIVIVDSEGVKISSNSNVAYLIVHVETIDPADNLVGVASESTTKFAVTKYTNEITGSVSKSITVTGSEAAYKAFTATLKVDNSLIPTSGSYLPVPDGVIEITDAEFAKDATSATATVSISAENLARFTVAGTYLVPIVVSQVSPATLSQSSAVTYLEITVKIFDYSSNFFSALYLGNPDMATNYIFASPIQLNTFSITFQCYIEELTSHSRIGDFCDANENFINMLRFGQYGDKGILDWFVGPNGKRVNVKSTTSFEAGKWYQVGLCYDGTNYDLYVDGKLESSVAAAEGTGAFSFQRWEFNSSWGGSGYRNGNEFKGRLMEVSIFSHSFTSGSFSAPASEWFEMCNQNQPGMYDYLITHANTFGLRAYWPCHDGTGSILEEKSGRYESVDFSKTYRDNDDGNGMAATDVSGLIEWKADANNNFNE